MIVQLGEWAVNPSYVECVKLPSETPLHNHVMLVRMQSGIELSIYGDTKEIVDNYYEELAYFCNNRKARDTGSRLDKEGQPIMAEELSTSISKKSSKSIMYE